MKEEGLMTGGWELESKGDGTEEGGFGEVDSKGWVEFPSSMSSSIMTFAEPPSDLVGIRVVVDCSLSEGVVGAAA